MADDVAYSFDVASDGRTLRIRREPPATDSYDSRDRGIQAAMAAWRFSPGPARTGCRYVPAPRRTPLATADRATLLQLMAENRPGFGADQIVRAVRTPNSDCHRDRPDPRLLAYPPFDEIKAAPGRRDWTTVGFDLDADGRPQGVTTLASSGNPALDDAGRTALSRSQFEPGARRGCTSGFFKTAPELPAPPRPNIETFVRPGDDCPNMEARKGRVKLVNGAPIYPPEFARRNILGWAVVRFDVASWGAIGPSEIVAAEPAIAFGQAAQNMVRTARADPGPGWRGCLQHVTFKIADEGEEAPAYERDLRLR